MNSSLFISPGGLGDTSKFGGTCSGGRGWGRDRYDSSPRNSENRGKSCIGNVTSFAKVPRKCQNKMCWLRSGDEKSIPGFPEANPSTSQHPSQAEELVIWQFSSEPWTAPQIRLHIPTRPQSARHGDWHHGQRKGRSCSHIHGSLPSGFREKTYIRENPFTRCRVFTHTAKGPSQPMLHLTSIHAFGCY